MRRFSFRLEGLARVRRLDADLARQAYGVAMRALREREEMLYEAVTALTDFPSLEGTVGAGEYEWHLAQSSRLADGVRSSSAAFEAARARATEMGDRWREAERRSRILERLENAARVQWWEEYRRDEARELDDVATRRAARSA